MLSNYITYFLAALLIITNLIWYVVGKNDTKGDAVVYPSRSDIGTAQMSTVCVQPKTSQSQPDLKVTTTYVANINGKRVDLPVETVTDTAAPTSATPYHVAVKQQIDVSNLIKPPKWSFGVGAGVHDSKFYVPMSMQYNYKDNKQVQFSVHLDKNLRDINGVEVQHRWYF